MAKNIYIWAVWAWNSLSWSLAYSFSQNGKDKEKIPGGGDISSYMKKRYFRFLPYTTAAFIFTFLICRIVLYVLAGGKLTMSYFAAHIAEDIWELLLVSANGLNNNHSFLNPPVWTISAMLIVEFFILCLLTYHESRFVHAICPLSILIILGYYRQIESLNLALWHGFTTFGVIRVYFIMCCAYYCYRLAVYLQKTTFTRAGVTMLNTAEILCFVLVFLIVFLGKNRYFVWCAMLLMLIGCGIILSGQSFSTKLFKDSKLTRYLGKLSFAVFLVHVSIFRLYGYFSSNVYELYRQKYSFILAVTVVSVIFLYVMNGFMHLARKKKGAIRNLLIQEE